MTSTTIRALHERLLNDLRGAAESHYQFALLLDLDGARAFLTTLQA